MEDELLRLQAERARLMGELQNLGSAVSTLKGTFYWGGKPIIDDDEGGSAGVREPRRPHPAPPHLGMEKALADDEGLVRA